MILGFLLGLLCLARPAGDKGEPLILEGAEHFTVEGRGAMVNLVGNVRFHRGDVKLRADQALWDRSQDVVNFNGNFQVDHPSGKIRSFSGRYERATGSAMATNGAVLTDSTGKVTLTANTVTYNRLTRTAEAFGAPVFRKIDTLDTLEIRAQRLIWQEKEKIAQALGDVTLRKGTLVAKASEARLEQNSHKLFLRGSPVATMGKRVLKGREIQLIVDLKTQKIREITVNRNAEGVFQNDPDSSGQVNSGRLSGDTLHALVDGDVLKDVWVWNGAKGSSWSRDTTRKDELEGDSIGFTFDGKKLRQVRAFRKAVGKFRSEADSAGVSQCGRLSADTLIAWLVDGRFQTVSVWPKAKGLSWRSNDTTRKDELEGDSIGFAFDGKKLGSARVRGAARSYYHHLENGKYKGKNEARGDLLRIAFKNGRVNRVRITGTARGTYWGEPKTKDKTDSTSAKADSLRPPAPRAPK